jgi:hypothetical protein
VETNSTAIIGSVRKGKRAGVAEELDIRPSPLPCRALLVEQARF